MNRTLELSFENMICDRFALCFLIALRRCRCDDKECFVGSRWPVKQRWRMRALKAGACMQRSKTQSPGEICCLKISFFFVFYFSLVAFRSCDSSISVTTRHFPCKKCGAQCVKRASGVRERQHQQQQLLPSISLGGQGGGSKQGKSLLLRLGVFWPSLLLQCGCADEHQ